MKYDEIIKLLDAGYSREEIMKMEEPDPKPADDPKPAHDPKPADDPKPAGDPKPADDVLKGFADEVKAAIKDLTKEITAANIMASRQQPESDNADVLANIINPKIDKNGGN